MVEKENPLRAWRQSRGLTQNDAAILLNTRATVICNIESGERPAGPRILAALVAYGVDPAAFEVSYNAFIKAKRESIRARIYPTSPAAV